MYSEAQASAASKHAVIELAQVAKCYQIYEKPHDRLLQVLMRGRKQYYREFWALHDFNLCVEKGESIGIIGRNGAGKSTLLQIICRTLQPTNGTVTINGRVAALLELGSGFNPEFTGRENVIMSATILGLSADEISQKFNDIVAFADIGDHLDQSVKTYSSGMYVRLAFAVIAHVDADILIIDEALSVGDAFFTQKCMRFLKTFRKRGTLLFVSHDTAAVVNFCDRAIWLEAGTVRMTGTAKKVTQSYLEGLSEIEDPLHVASSGEQDQTTSISEDVNITNLATANARTKYWDQRLSLINSSHLRNDIEVFQFNHETESFGKQGGSIIDVYLRDGEEDRDLSWVVGGEQVRICIQCQSNNSIELPIIGFFIKDRLGQYLFGDNTALNNGNEALTLEPGDKITADFLFSMPILLPGEYSVAAAFASGSNQTHIMHHWIHDALTFTSHTSSIATGMIGIPMENITLRVNRV